VTQDTIPAAGPGAQTTRTSTGRRIALGILIAAGVPAALFTAYIVRRNDILHDPRLTPAPGPGPTSREWPGSRCPVRGSVFALAECRTAAGTVLTAPLSGHQVMINGHALCPPFSFVRCCDPFRPAPRWGACSEVRTNDLDGRRSVELPGDGHHGHVMWRAQIKGRS
jgi:hypothetical protein